MLALAAALLALTGGGAALAHDDEDDFFHHMRSDLASRTGSPASTPGSAKRLEIIGHANPGVGYNADVVAHRDYAYLGSRVGTSCLSKGVRVFDISDPTKPTHVSTFGDAASDPRVAQTWTEKVIVRRVDTKFFKGDLAVASFQACGNAARLNPAVFRGFGLYDVTDPVHPRTLALYSTEPGVNPGSHEIWLAAKGRSAYVYTAINFSELRTAPNATTPGKPDFRIVDVSKPTAPVEVGSWGAWKELGIHPTSGQGDSVASFAHSVITNEAATLAFLSYWDTGTVILDIADPSRPRFLGRTTFLPGEQGDAHSAWLAKGEDVLIQTQETFPPSPPGRPLIYDISNPASPVRLAEFSFPGSDFDSVHDPKVRGSNVFLSWYFNGIAVMDISRPRSPRLVAQILPPAGPPNPDFPFCTGSCTSIWGVFPHRDYLLASDEANGLWVLKLRH
jgi:hypothetical protein